MGALSLAQRYVQHTKESVSAQCNSGRGIIAQPRMFAPMEIQSKSDDCDGGEAVERELQDEYQFFQQDLDGKTHSIVSSYQLEMNSR